MQSLEIIQDIASYIQIISSKFIVSHSKHLVIETQEDIIRQLQKLPKQIQDEYLVSLLKGLLRGIYFDGSLAQKNTQVIKTDYWDFENKVSEIDWEFYEKLDENNTGEGSYYSGFRVLRQETDGSLAVEHLGVTVHIQPKRHLQLAEQSAAVGDVVAIWTPPSQLKPGFYTAVGDAFVNFNFKAPQVVVYFNFNSEGAVATMQSLTARLNAINIPFTFLVFYNPSDYGLYNSGILRCERSNYERLRQVLETIYTENQSYFHVQAPLFTKVLAPGLALAEAPEEQFFQVWNDFGGSRCQILANALFEAYKNSDDSPKNRMKYILKHFEQFGINIEYPYLNPNSEDNYTPLDL